MAEKFEAILLPHDWSAICFSWPFFYHSVYSYTMACRKRNTPILFISPYSEILISDNTIIKKNQLLWLDFPTTSIPLPHWKSIFLCVCVCVLYVRVCTRVWLKVHSSFPTSKFLYREFSLHRWEESWEGWLKAGVFSLWNSKGLQSFSFHSIEPERSCSRCLASGTQLAGHTSPGFWTLSEKHRNGRNNWIWTCVVSILTCWHPSPCFSDLWRSFGHHPFPSWDTTLIDSASTSYPASKLPFS